jgi:DNA-binding XRE family transcriptional regulator
MTTEILRLTKVLKDQGYISGSDAIESLTLSLERDYLLPHSIYEKSPVLKGSFSEQLRGYRIQHELSQRDLAQTTGINHSTLSRLEHGNRKPLFGTVKAIIQGLSLNEEQTLNFLNSFQQEA